MLQTSLLLIKYSNKTETPFSIYNVFYVSIGNLFYFYFTTLQLVLVPCGGCKTSPLIHHSVDYIFITFGITGPIVVSLKKKKR